MSEIPITYLCWGCGSEKTVYEDSRDCGKEPAVEKWNLCYDCIKGAEAKEKIEDTLNNEGVS